MHDPVRRVLWLRKVVLGYYQYHAVPGNLDAVAHLLPAHRLRLWRSAS